MTASGAASDSEREPLLSPSTSYLINPESQPLLSSASDGGAIRRDYDGQARHGESYDNVPQAKRQLGTFSTVFLIFNRIIGTGIYAAPSIILRGCGSVGVTLLVWLFGASITAIGTAVYIELGTGLPRSGGDKNYLEFIYRNPKFLSTCVYALYCVIIGSAAANSLVFGEYFIHAIALTPSSFTTRMVAFGALAFCVTIHGCFLKWGIRLQNTLGVFKLFILTAISLSGILSLAGVKGFEVKPEYEKPRNFEWDHFWEGSGTGANAIVAALYNVCWAFNGYANANNTLSEVKDPVKTLKRAAPIAVVFVTSVYLFINIAYFGVVSKRDILESERIIAALYFRNLFGPAMERALSGFIALSVMGNLLAGQFAVSRVIQELGREGILPTASFFSSNKPFNAPLAALAAQGMVSTIILMTPPAGDAYLFMISLSTYSLTLIFVCVSGGLLLLYTPAYKEWNWDPPFKAGRFTISVFFLSNVFLLVVPLIPPTTTKVYRTLPYWSHPAVSVALSTVGFTYWYLWWRWLPRRQGYRLERKLVMQDDGVSKYVFQKIPTAAGAVDA